MIYGELVISVIKESSRDQYRQIIDGLVREGVEGIILGCTEIGLLIHKEDSQVLLFDTTRIHAVPAVDYALQP